MNFEIKNCSHQIVLFIRIDYSVTELTKNLVKLILNIKKELDLQALSI